MKLARATCRGTARANERSRRMSVPRHEAECNDRSGSDWWEEAPSQAEPNTTTPPRSVFPSEGSGGSVGSGGSGGSGGHDEAVQAAVPAGVLRGEVTFRRSVFRLARHLKGEAALRD